MDKKRILFNSKRDKGIIAKMIVSLYGVNLNLFKTFLRKVMWRWLGIHHEFYSVTLRKIFKKHYGVEVGMYTHGGCFIPGSMPPGTVVGRYCSIAHGALALLNHPLHAQSTHAFFFNPTLGYVDQESMAPYKLVIGNDVWIGQNSIILPGCASIGDGAVIGAGSVVNKDIPPYAIALGNPCRVVQYRFSNERIAELLEQKWWDKPIEELSENIGDFMNPGEGGNTPA